MTPLRMPLFVWSGFNTQFLIIVSIPSLTAAN